MSHDARPASNDALDWEAAFGIVSERFIRHLLLHLEATGLFAGIIRYRFVNISGHEYRQVMLLSGESLIPPRPTDQPEKMQTGSP